HPLLFSSPDPSHPTSPPFPYTTLFRSNYLRSAGWSRILNAHHIGPREAESPYSKNKSAEELENRQLPFAGRTERVPRRRTDSQSLRLDPTSPRHRRDSVQCGEWERSTTRRWDRLYR